MLSLSHIIHQHANLPAFQVTLTDVNGNPVDVTSATSITLRMQLVGDPTVVRSGSCSVIEPGAGLVSYEFASADTQFSGVYLATISVDFPSSKLQVFPLNDYYVINVDPDLESDIDDFEAELVFATVADARSMGKELTAEDLLIAQGHIEIMCGRMIPEIQYAMEYDRVSTSDLRRLKVATVYQAIWVKANADEEERTDVTQIRTAGLSGEAATLAADGIVLAPLARRLLQRLSWIRSRSVKTSLRGSAGNSVSMNTTNGPGWTTL